MSLKVADLFAGAGGASTGLQLAASALGQSLDLVAVNHWPAAVETHAANHPDARHLCEAIERVDPRDAVPGGELDLLLAGPSCTQHSHARSNRAVDDKDRASAWQIPRWLDLLRVERVLIENVPAFQNWAPLGENGRPIREARGQVYRAYLAAIEAMNYRVEVRIVNAADHGEATTRRRLFIQCARNRGRIVWPDPSHARRAGRTLLRREQPWRPAKDVIDWSLPARSIFARPKPLSTKTLRRIDNGLRRFGGRPFLLGQHGGGAPRPTTEPMPTVAGAGAIAVVEPFLSSYYGNGSNIPVSEPVPTITSRDRFALIVPEGDDVLYRMLQPHELAAAMGFPSDYRFVGTKSDITKMIGNAWSVRTAEALCRVILEQVTPARTPRRQEAVA